MINFIFKNHSFGKIVANPSIIQDLWEQYSFYVPGYKYMPKYKNGFWDGKIRLIDRVHSLFPTGLIENLKNWCEMNGYEYTTSPEFQDIASETEKREITEFIESLQFYSKGKEIYPREDQKRAIRRAIELRRCINVCPTSFGKSLCIFAQCLWHIQRDERCIIVVPSVNLVRQFKNDIIDYCTNTEGELTEYFPVIYEIHAGKEKNFPPETELVITTWQSIYKLDPKWINRFDVIILDEAHSGHADCITKVFNNAVSVKYRTGWTGTLKKSSLVGIQAEALMGQIETITNTVSLMDKGIVADMTIQLVRFKYNDTLIAELQQYFEGKRAATGKPTYHDEIEFLETNKRRNNTIIKMAGMFQTTGLLLYTHRKHGNELYEIARKTYPDKNIYKIDGSAVIRNDEKFKTYEELKGDIEVERDAILICSFGVFSTGVSIKNINYIFFTIPTKSYVRTIQSIGRGLRVSETKKRFQMIDIIDDLCVKKRSSVKENYAFRHFKERFEMYTEQNFKWDMSTIDIS